MSLMSRYRDRWWRLNLFQKTQAIGKLALAVVAVVFLFVPHAWMASIWWLSIIPFGLLSIAYAIGLRSSLSQFIDSRLGVTSRIALQALLVPISLGIARQYVADAFQLPPQSFDATVALLTVLVTPMLWFLLAAAVVPAGRGCGSCWPRLWAWSRERYASPPRWQARWLAHCFRRYSPSSAPILGSLI
ncbi:hypothetical protein [Burkholderia gladioli]|uniref:hypothetical protein n=1 Tax=Burkholderia gladioli TaxID=28095 RepID=UPI0016408C5C|nr:hypothetical protein [Burkholderia gladioli]